MVHGISIRFDFNGSGTSFRCTNSYQQHTDKIFNDGGLGNPLIRKRLELLYPDSHQLNIGEDGEIYTVELTINNTHELRHH
jgi:hypothetical protein